MVAVCVIPQPLLLRRRRLRRRRLLLLLLQLPLPISPSLPLGLFAARPHALEKLVELRS